MATRVSVIVTLLVVSLLMVTQTRAMFVPKVRSHEMAAAGDMVKRSAVLAQRQKRYTDYQERASAFCTGLCMYEERKSYSECFDLCNWHLSQEDEYDTPNHQTDYSGPLDTEPPSTTSISTAGYSDTDYSNDEATPNGQMTDFTTVQGQSTSPGKLSKAQQDNNKRRKGKKQKANKDKDKSIAAQQRRMLKDLKRRLLQEIDAKQDELSAKAIALQERIGSLENEIETSKQSMVDFEERLDHIRQEMSDIDGLKANVSMLVKGRRKLPSGKKIKSGELLPDDFLLPDNQFTDSDDIAKVLEQFLIKENDSKRAAYAAMNDGVPGVEYRPFEQTRTNNVGLFDKRRELNQAATNLDDLDEFSHAEYTLE